MSFLMSHFVNFYMFLIRTAMFCFDKVGFPLAVGYMLNKTFSASLV